MNRKQKRQAKRVEEKKLKKAGMQKLAVSLSPDKKFLALHFAISTNQIVMDKKLAVDLASRLIELSNKIEVNNEEKKSDDN